MRSLKDRAVELRRRGWSYNVIADRLGVSKSALSDWLRKVPYTPNQAVIARIRAGPAKSAESKQRIRLQEITDLQVQAGREIGQLSRRDLWFLGLGLYLGEGSKLYEMVRVINSDPQIIKLSMRWFREVCGVPTANFSIAVHLYPDTPIKQAVQFWSRVTGVPQEQFERAQIDRREGKSARKQRFLPYGTAHIKIRSLGNRQLGVTLHRRIMGWIDSLHEKLRV